jgi:hypothetical protein
VIAVIRLVRDSVDSKDGWGRLAGFVEKLPSAIADVEEIRETYALALANSGKVTDAIAKLEELLILSGPTPKRLGLLGGRYERLFVNAEEAADKADFLNRSIDAYQRGHGARSQPILLLLQPASTLPPAKTERR